MGCSCCKPNKIYPTRPRVNNPKDTKSVRLMDDFSIADEYDQSPPRPHRKPTRDCYYLMEDSKITRPVFRSPCYLPPSAYYDYK
jgi:hypothetical protein